MSKVQQQTYEVTAPDGTVLEVTGPAGASQDEVIRQAQLLYKPKAEAPSTTDRVLSAAKKAVDYAGSKIMGVPEEYVSRGSKQFYDTASGAIRGAYETAKEAASYPSAPLFGAAVGAKRMFVDPQLETLEKGKTAQTLPEKVGYGMASGVPILGPMAAHLGETLGTKGVPEAMGEAAFLALAGKAPEVIGKTVSGPVTTAKAALLKRAPGVYQKALQPAPGGFSMADIDTMVKTGLKEELPVSRSGLNKLDSLVDSLNKSIEADIAKNPNAPVSPTAVANRLKPLQERVKVQTNPEADVATVDSARAEFLRQHQTTGQQPRFILDREGNVTKTPSLPPADVTIPAEAAQAIKKGTYRQIKSRSYGEQGSARVEAEKALARGLKEELETHFPEIKGKNAREGQLFDLRPELEKEVNRMGNSTSISKAMSILRNPAITSRIAIMMYKAGVPKAVAQARIAAFANGLPVMASAHSQKK